MGKCLGTGILALSLTSSLWGGPVILGGDDLTDHGSRPGATNLLGWLYIQNAISNINSQVTRPGPYLGGDIAALGSANPGAGVYPAGYAGGAINSVANVLGLTVHRAKSRIRMANCSVGRISWKRSRWVGRVIKQHPKAGAERPAGARVRLVAGRL